MKIRSIEIVEDRTPHSRCDDGFLKLARLSLRNLYEDGTRSAAYACDVVSRPGSDAVVSVLYEVDGSRRVRVVLRESLRPPIYLRRFRQFEHPDPREYRSLLEVVAGIVERGDGAGDSGLRRRAAAEAEQEAGVHAAAERFAVIGGETFASPGTSDEKVYDCAADVSLASRGAARGDGSVMEEVGELVEWELAEAIEACRDGRIPDMKTEVALLRLADHIGYLPQLGCFADDLSADLRARHRRLGVSPSRTSAA